MSARARVARSEPLNELAAEEAACRRCQLYKNATQVVPGEGRAKARLMLVGEQPGDSEDVEGRPFVGPAGRLLDDALGDAGIEPGKVFITNAVKHFKFERRGKRRIHRRPDAYEIERCRWWLDLERRLIKPRVIVALGTTAARSLLGKPTTIKSVRGEPIALEGGGTLFVTVHPSSLLRMPDRAVRAAAYRTFVKDLKTAADAL
ncbi:MAG: UdgX family uracil-DNA binding protein [Parvibaculum sp.]|uniref:UdgX family uracil-DNA binding protein n=1 Tax=Parvibaculum sp. TaxID=2024848 RepID=UPI0025FE1087|nr:UdgX family uracil-DNA binding protein [Parvibaculum sp.]MCE9649799.1 UdgX family uracil-DNA binding protein [Parvibaculum sp.]